jgi:DNA-binding SARP family transcriptional activator
VSLTIQLLGRPQIVRDGTPVAGPRGHKAWALLAYLLRAEARPSREVVAGLLFPDADDPLGALRWTLSAVRRSLGAPGAFRGDPVDPALPPGTVVDVEVVSRGGWQEAVRLPGLGRRLLEGVNPAAGATFELWLENQQRQLAAAAEDLLHEAALANLAHGDAGTALDLASRLVQLNSLDANAQELYVRCLASAGHVERARRQVEACTALFRAELGVEPPAALREAAEARPPSARPAGRAGVLAQLEAGEAAFAAGAVHAGLGILQQAVVDAESGADTALLAQALVALGSALVHAARGSDEEGSPVLHRAIEVTRQVGDDTLAATAHRELGYVEFLRGRYARAEHWLVRAVDLAAPGGEERAWALAVLGASRTDTGDHAAARRFLAEASEAALAAGAPRAEGWARSFLGRLHLLRGEATAGRTELEASIDIARRHGWNSFVPWPEALLAEIDLDEGAVEMAARAFDHAFAMGCQLGDPCWESLAARGLGRVAMVSGDVDRAVELLTDAPRRCRRLPDSYRWVEAYALGALADVAVAAGLEEAGPAIAELEAIAARHGMRELMVTAAILRARRGEAGALDTAGLMVSELDNPVLHEQVATAGALA